jgi:uncharacterized protein YqjF (DUF2071 family)
MNANMLTAAPPRQAGPAERPLPSPFLTAGWRHLLMLNFEVDPALLAARVPPGLELDVFEGRTFVSLVGFRFTDARVFGWSVPCHRNFEEVNLRFYVRRTDLCTGESEARRGVMFIKELVPRRLVAWVARRFYNENFCKAPMRSRVMLPTREQNGAVEYAWWLAGRWQRLAARIAGVPQPPAAGSEAEFIAEHYWGYSRQRDGSTLEYQVEHPPWRIWPTESAVYDADVAALYGTEFAAPLQRPPSSAFVAEGSDVLVRRGVPLTLAPPAETRLHPLTPACEPRPERLW